MNIIFGTRKVSQRNNSGHVKYPNRPVVTIEGNKGEGKSRRLLFNEEAMKVLNLPVGSSQCVIMAFVEANELGNRMLLIANADMLENKAQTVVYNTSKNKVSFEESKEKGKGISNSNLHKELNQFLEIDENISHEYDLKHFGTSEGLDLYSFEKILYETDNQSVNDYIRNPLTFETREELSAILDGEVLLNTEAESFDYHEADVHTEATQPEWN